MIASAFGVLTLLIVLVVSARSYDHRDGHYATGKTDRIATPVSFAWVYRYVQVTTALGGLLAYFVVSRWFRLHSDPILIVVGSVIALLGLVLFIRAKATLGSNYSPCFDSYVPQSTVQEGLYGLIRHPIYTANLVVLAGLGLATGSPFLIVNFLLVGFYYNLSAQTEEVALAERFPDYRDYMQRTGRFLPSYLSRSRRRTSSTRS